MSGDKAPATDLASSAALWSRFATATTQQEYLSTWMALLCQHIPEVFQAVLLLGLPHGSPFQANAIWPAQGTDPKRLHEIANRALAEKCGMVLELERPAGPAGAPAGTGSHYALAYPVMLEEQIYGVIAVEVAATSEASLTVAMQQLQWGAAWVEALIHRRERLDDRAVLGRLRSAVELMGTVMREEQYQSACIAFVTGLATHLQCDRVSLGFMRRNHARVQAISHSAQFGQHMKLNRALGTAMEESIVQRVPVIYPPAQEALAVTRDHEKLARDHGIEAILTYPLHAEAGFYGAITLERAVSEPFDEDDVRFCQAVSALVGPALEEKRRNDRWIVTKVAESIGRQARRLLGPGYFGRKLVLLTVLSAIAFFRQTMAEYRITARTVLEAAVIRSLVAPFDGYVNVADFRAGDVVKKGDVLCSLDDKDLLLERLKYLSQETQLQRQFQEAMSQHDTAKAGIIEAQTSQIKAQLNQVSAQLDRTRVVAPFEGLITEGDLSQRLGGSVKQGEVLFELAPLTQYRAILEVDERHIRDVKVGQTGELILTALPHQRLKFEVEKITPVATAREGLNFFRVEAETEEVSEKFQPGMEGVAKITVDRRLLFVIWTKDILDWIRLKVWSWAAW